LDQDHTLGAIKGSGKKKPNKKTKRQHSTNSYTILQQHNTSSRIYPIMKLLPSFVVISIANAASQNSGLIRGRGSSSADADADAADTMAAATATHMVPGDIFAGLLSNSWTPQEYCPTGSQYNPNGPQWPREDGCYPG
jgi:hypothetical protein